MKRPTSSKVTFYGVSLVVLFAAGCMSWNDQYGMKSQSGESVEVKRDYFGVPPFAIPVSDPYYYENGAKVYVNQGNGEGAPARHTDWNGDK